MRILSVAILLIASHANLKAQTPMANSATEIVKQLQSWRARPHLFCSEGRKNFPSKMFAAAWTCDDGDMTLFNGLYAWQARSKVARPSETLEDRNGDGSWWRSPKKVGHGGNSSSSSDKHQTNFNSDQALGVYAYLS